MITGAHTLIYCEDPQAARAWLRDVLGLPHVDAGDGWLIFALPPAEVAVHPADPGTGRHELTLMCDDIEATVAELTAKGAEFTTGISDRGWGRIALVKVPGAGEMGIYEPRHPVATDLPA
jgi:catechol 2,3-dioxygenase-like lactoylglutathione lyase family enzyme